MDDIGRVFGIVESVVCQIGRRIAGQMGKDAKLTRMVKKVQVDLSRMKP